MDRNPDIRVPGSETEEPDPACKPRPEHAAAAKYDVDK